MGNHNELILILGGPTASGKSALALDLARHFQGVVINADSMQIYHELRILTARPSTANEKVAPHRLYGTMPGKERCSAGRWRKLALDEIAKAKSQNQMPILVGGTGLYIRSLLKGLAPVPDIPQTLRNAVKALRAELGARKFHRRLAARDPEDAAKIHPADSQRVLRAYEVLEATGTSLAEWQASRHGETAYPGRAKVLLLEPERDALYANCDARAGLIVESGGVKEVETLRALGLDPGLPVMKALGVRELGALLDGEVTRAQAVENLRRATRRYAKRQNTWFRHQIAESTRFLDCYNTAHRTEVLRLVEDMLLTQ